MLWGVVLNIKHRVPDDVDCCSRCWSKVPVAERLKFAVTVRDRAPDGILNILAVMGEQALVAHQQKG